MTTLPQTPAVHELDPAVRSRSLIVASRLMLGANVSVQFSFLFAFLYLRAQDYNGMWHPAGVGPPPIGLALTVLILQAAAGAVVWTASVAMRRSATLSRLPNVLALSAVIAVACLAFRVYQITHMNWTPDEGTYVDVSLLWFGVMAAEVLFGALWLIRLFAGQARRTIPVAAADLRSAAEFWAFLTVVWVGVFALVQFVT